MNDVDTGGRMFPLRGDLHIAPFSDENLYMEQFNKANFWYQTCFHGVDLSAMRNNAMKEYFRQPIVDTFDIRICMAKSIRHIVDFQTANETDLHKIGENSWICFIRRFYRSLYNETYLISFLQKSMLIFIYWKVARVTGLHFGLTLHLSGQRNKFG